MASFEGKYCRDRINAQEMLASIPVEEEVKILKMSLKNLFKIAMNALLRNKFRAFLTMLGIIIGVASVIAMLGIGEGSKLAYSNRYQGWD